MSNPAIEFENIMSTLQGNSKSERGTNKKGQGQQTEKSSLMPKSSDLFESIIEANDTLDLSMQELVDEIENIKHKRPDSFDKNLTFSLTFKAINVAIKEYEYQSTLFAQYSNLYDEMCNEENIVKVLDLLRLIVTDRRAILKDITDNIIKIQRLDNDRIKMDSGNTDDEFDDIVAPDSI